MTNAKQKTATTAPADQPVPVSLVRPVKHDGIDYVIGDLLELGERAAQALIDAGAAVIAGVEERVEVADEKIDPDPDGETDPDPDSDPEPTSKKSGKKGK